MPAQDFRKLAGNGSDVKDYDNCGFAISRQCFRDAAHSIQSACRCPYGNDVKIRRRHGVLLLRLGKNLTGEADYRSGKNTFIGTLARLGLRHDAHDEMRMGCRCRNFGHGTGHRLLAKKKARPQQGNGTGQGRTAAQGADSGALRGRMPRPRWRLLLQGKFS
jgi:hypothetical protein